MYNVSVNEDLRRETNRLCHRGVYTIDYCVNNLWAYIYVVHGRPIICYGFVCLAKIDYNL